MSSRRAVQNYFLAKINSTELWHYDIMFTLQVRPRRVRDDSLVRMEQQLEVCRLGNVQQAYNRNEKGRQKRVERSAIHLRRPLPNRCNSCHSHYMKINHISYCDNTSSPLTCRVHRVHHTKSVYTHVLFLLLFEPFQYCSWIMAGWTFPLKLSSWVVFLHCTMIISVYIIYFSSFLIIFLLYSSSSSS